MFDTSNDNTVGPAVSEVSVLADSDTRFDVAGVAPDVSGVFDGLDNDLCVRAVQLEGVRRLLDGERARVFAALDADGTTDAEHGMRTGSWVAAVCAQPAGPSKTVVRHSKQLTTRFPILFAALNTAQISWAHIETILRAANPRIIDNIIAIQTELLVLADRYTFDRWATEVTAICHMIDVDGGHDPPATGRRRSQLVKHQMGCATSTPGSAQNSPLPSSTPSM